MKLEEEDKRTLLTIARAAIESQFSDGSLLPAEPAVAVPEKAGAFVTLKMERELRGCIGFIEAERPLSTTVRDAAVRAAFDDPRFSPLSKQECKLTKIEISVLHEPERILSPDEITIGTHGLILDAGFRRGLLLPQVALEYRWNPVEFLEHTAEKAGLPRDSWKKSGVKIFRFETQIFSEESLPVEPLHVRPPAVAGLFYASDRSELQAQVADLLAESDRGIPEGELVALVVPHAGYQYSGETAACAYNLLDRNLRKTIVLIGPSHRAYFDGISIPTYDAFRTPLGTVTVDRKRRDEVLRLGKKILHSDQGHTDEHSLEVQLPFIQSILHEFSILTIVMGDQSRDWCEYLSGVLARISEPEKILFIASSDLSHYHSYEVAHRLDDVVANAVKNFDVKSLSEKLDHHEVEACGGGPMSVVMSVAKSLGADKSQVLHACNSGDVTGDHGRVVGYLSAALFKSPHGYAVN